MKDFVDGFALHTSRRMVITARGGIGNFVEGCALHTSHKTRLPLLGCLLLLVLFDDQRLGNNDDRHR